MSDITKKTPFIKLAYLTLNESSTRTFLDYDFFLILKGSLRIRKDAQTFFLEENDILLLESGKTYGISSAGNNIILSIVIDSNFFSNGRSLQTGHYICNSALDSSRDYTPLRQLLSHITTIYFSNSDIQNLNLTSLAYNLLYYLNAYHYEADTKLYHLCANNKYKDRLMKILDYIHQNYATPITLQEVADYLSLSTPYLSAFFKQNLKENFNNYVNRIRLEHAVENLIYTDKSITAITYDNGFASMNAFNKLFKEKYFITPHKYRIQKIKERHFNCETLPLSIQELNASNHHSLLPKPDTSMLSFMPNIQFPSQKEIEIDNMQKSETVIPIWKTLLNIGPLSQLSKRDIERQMIQVQNGVGFQYARIEHVMNNDVIPINPKTGKLLFTSYDRTIDNLTMHQLIPYLDLSPPTWQMEQLEDKHIVLNLDFYLSALEQLVTHSANMYELDAMENWYFEINHYENLFSEQYESIPSFLERFSKAYECIKSIVPNAKVGGICHDVIFPYDRYLLILKGLKERNIVPDFLSIGIFPYECIPKENKKQSSIGLYYTKDTSFPLHKVQEFKEQILSCYEILPAIHIAYLAPDIFYHNYMNDTCFQSSFFFHNTVDLIGEIDMLGYYQMSDIGSQPEESNDFLEGRNGLFNKYGIKKPGCHLLEIFSQAKQHLVAKERDFVILKGTNDRYMIGLCNYTYIRDYQRLSIAHDRILITDAYNIYENPQTKNVSLKLHQLALGDYDVLIYQINKNHGSVFDEWERNAYWDRYDRNELEYMRKILQPLKTHQTKTCTDGTLEFHIQLAPHEVLFIALLHRF